MTCKKCKKQIPEGSIYCNLCGAPQKKNPKKHLYQRPDGLFERSLTVNGKRVVFRGRSEAEVERKILEYTERKENGRPFAEIAEEWKAVHFPTLSPNTLRGYRPALQRAVNEFGGLPVSKIKPAQIKQLLANMARKGFARKTVSTQLLICNLICSYAIEQDELEANPCAAVSLPKNLSKEYRKPASPEDEARIKASYGIWLLPYLILYTGLRKGEALALTYGDIADGFIYVSKSVCHVSNRPIIKTPKTAAGIRKVPILTPLADKLPTGPAENYVFSADGGRTPLTETQYQSCWKKFAAQTGVTATAHQLRHSYATMLFECGISVKDAQNLLGHATAAMTTDVYTHLRDTHQQEIIDELNRQLAAV
ncbi:MAG: tyrosine-type recombinase/integrase [Oscillospiraceae bacterium]|jgi:integrase|nr:tyrosine-type recombinase/integrase [Oscillospiraceae bacterium]